ncbi:MAG: hypothetical protein QG641_1299 [Candidatus Poribacteria bacterium]|nr:hypothetical protein [Candidatus Poribacteria bacterium]
MNPLKVLFIGNSYTYCNKMPWIVSKLAESDQRNLVVDMVTQGGVSLEWHAHNQDTLDAIEKGDWNIVVLQDFSLGPIENREKMHQFGMELNQHIQKIGAETVLYMTWARQHIPEMINDLADAYISLGKSINAKVAPVGIAWKNALETNPDLILHTEDKSHPTPSGSYLSACVFYSTFYNSSPEGLTRKIVIDDENIVDLNDEDALFLQKIAWRTFNNL